MGLTPVEHTSDELSLTQTVQENTVPILPMVVDHILTPNEDADNGRLAEDGRLVGHALRRLVAGDLQGQPADRKSTRLNSSHVAISYAVFCLKKKIGEQGVTPRV